MSDRRKALVAEKKYQRTFRPAVVGNGTTAKVKRKTWNLRLALEEFEKQLIIDALEQNLGHRGKTAAMLGINRKTLYTKLKKQGIT